ncbi:MAG: hypothetical protein Q7S33_02440 [Nanoarchaeota archaeon]|nr:hypothetical protein [Nanoarchaeota archaeon]
MNSSSFTPKSFWEKPEGTWGMVIGVLGALGLGWVLYKALPFIIVLLQNVITTILLGVALFAILWVLFDKRFQILVSSMYKSAVRFIAGIFITIDPIGILKNYVEGLQDNLNKMSTQISNLRGQMRNLEILIKQNEKERIDALTMVKRAQEAGKRGVVVLKARKAGRLETSNVTLQDLFNKMELLFRVLEKMREASGLLIEDLVDEIDVKSRERKMVYAGWSAIRSAKSIINGENDKRAMFEQTMDYLAADYGEKVGEIEDFVSMSAGFLDTIDLQNGVYEENAMKMLEEWERKPESILLGNDNKQIIIAAANDPNDVFNFAFDINGKPADAKFVEIPRKTAKEGASDEGYRKFLDDDK